VLDGCAWLCCGSVKACSGEVRMYGYGRMFNNKSTHVFSLLLWECMEKQAHAGNIERGVVIHRGIRMWYLCFAYTPISIVSLI